GAMTWPSSSGWPPAPIPPRSRPPAAGREPCCSRSTRAPDRLGGGPPASRRFLENDDESRARRVRIDIQAVLHQLLAGEPAQASAVEITAVVMVRWVEAAQFQA